MVTTDHDRCLQLAIADHLVEGEAQLVAIPRPTQQMRAGRPWNAMRSRAMSSQLCRCLLSGSSSFTLASVL